MSGGWAAGHPILTAAETRAAEQALFARGIAVEELMERAGRATADLAWSRFGPLPALVVCGPGNNGGDGYVVARRLAERGMTVRVAASGEPRTDAARAARAAWGGPVAPLAAAEPAPLLVDALFGTGLVRPLDGAIAEPATRLFAAARRRVAIDLPSGLATDTGEVLTALPAADLTVALGALKRGHRLMPGLALCGEVVVADIGLPLPDGPEVPREIAAPRLPGPGVESDKYKRGKVLVAAGTMPGATLLTAAAAARAGAGYVELLGNPGEGSPHAIVRRAWDGEALEDERVRALVLGPGLGTGEESRRRLEAALACGRPLVLDADALNLLAKDGRDRLAGRDPPPVLTPHEGEFARLFGKRDGSTLDRVREAARSSGAVLLLKGAATVVAHPDGRAAINPPAPAWLATAGTGDVLAGVLGTMLAQLGCPFEAACAAAWLHAEAARRAGPLLVADDLLPAVREAAAACIAR